MNLSFPINCSLAITQIRHVALAKEPQHKKETGSVHGHRPLLACIV